MRNIQWQKDFSTGHAKIDQQHQNLIDLLNISEGNSSCSKTQMYKALTSFVAERFSKEEELMRVHQYPFLQEHLSFHDRFVTKFLNTNSDQLNEELSTINEPLHELIQDHIFIDDLKLFEWLKEHQYLEKVF